MVGSHDFVAQHHRAGPLIGGLITVNASSDWNMIVMAIFASVSLVLVSLVPETYM